MDSGSLDAAFEGSVEAFLYTPPSPEAGTMARHAIAAARRAGGPHIVRLSEISPESVSALRVGRLHLESNAELQSSGLLHTISRPVQLMQVMLFAAPIIASEDMI